MARRFNRWDGVGVGAVVVFAAAFAALAGARGGDAGPGAVAQLLDASREIQLGEEWMGLYFKGARVGLMRVEKSARGEGFRYEMETRVRLQGLGQVAPLEVRVGAELDRLLVLQRFDFALDAGAAKFAGQGTVRGSVVEMVVETGGETVRREVALASPPVLRANLGPLLSRGGLEAGRRARFHVFDPMTQSDQPVDVEVLGPDSVLVFDREVAATRIRMRAGGLVLDGWINERGEMLRQELGLGLVAVRETEEQARFAWAAAGRGGADLVAATRVPVAGLAGSVAGQSVLRLRVGGVDLAGFELGDRRQRLDGDVLTIEREGVGAGLARPVALAPVGPAPAGSLAADALVQSDHPRIRAAAAAMVGEGDDTVTAARSIARWVHGHLKRRSVAGVPSALETLQRRVGDCNEHSTLFAALARSVGVPTRIVVGLVYVDGAFGYHAWNEVLGADGWVSVDATWDQMPVDVGHVAFLRGGLGEQVRLLPVIGQLRLSAVD